METTEAPKVWFYIQPGSTQTLGPIDAYTIAGKCLLAPSKKAPTKRAAALYSSASDPQSNCAGLLDSATITIDSHVWAEGQNTWKALKDVPGLYSQVYYISSTGASVRPSDGQAGALSCQISAGLGM